MLTSPDGGPCFICRETCHAIHYDFETFVHDGACLQRLWDDYFAALASAPSGTGD